MTNPGQNRKPDKICPGNFFPQKLRNLIMSLMKHNFCQLTKSKKDMKKKVH